VQKDHIGPAAINLSPPVMRLGTHDESRVFRARSAASSCRYAVMFVHLISAFTGSKICSKATAKQ
jgi:hypothetical protein